MAGAGDGPPPPWHRPSDVRCRRRNGTSDGLIASDPSDAIDGDPLPPLNRLYSSLPSSSSSLDDDGGGADPKKRAIDRPKEGGGVGEGPESSKSTAEFDPHKFLRGRMMTAAQERVNALTMLPNPMYGIYFVLSGRWLSDEAVTSARDGLILGSWDPNDADVRSECVRWDLLPRIHSSPPLTVMAMVFAIVIHVPFSFLYHWKYAVELPPDIRRVRHWSRRLDQCFIHVGKALFALGTSGRWDYFLLNLLYSLDCSYRLFQPEIKPRRTQIRVLLSMISYVLPIAYWCDLALLLEICALLVLICWLFASYPVGGWSHAAFHCVTAVTTPLLLEAACAPPGSRERIDAAARCAVLVEM